MVEGNRDLKVWEKAVDLVVASYGVTMVLSKSEMFGLSAQIRRATVSIPANIAEGHGRNHLSDYLRHLSVVNGSLMEFETHFLVMTRLFYTTTDDVRKTLDLTGEVGGMLAGLTSKLKARLAAP